MNPGGGRGRPQAKKAKMQGPGNRMGAKQAQKAPAVIKVVDGRVITAEDVGALRPPVVDPLEQFKTFYKEINIVEETEWNTFLKFCKAPIPLSFRFIESYASCPSHIDTIPGVPSQTRVFIQYLKSKLVESLGKLSIDSKTNVSLAPLPWYPNELGWSLNVPKEEADKYLGLKKFDDFINSSMREHKVQMVETWSMVPAALMDIQPHHVVLDMCAAPGFLASQLALNLHRDPLQAQAGLLIMNDLYRARSGMLMQWVLGLKTAFANFDARSFPDFYLSSEKNLQNALKYDRVICDVKCSSDGTMRKNVSLQESWNCNKSLHLHSEQKAILRRALELVKVKGQVLYTTTTMNPIENEAVVMDLIKESAGSVELVDCRPRLTDFKVRPGLTNWKVMMFGGRMLESYEEGDEEFRNLFPCSVFPPPIKEAMAFHMERCIRVLPHDNNTAGFFCAVLVKSTELPWIQERIVEEMAANKLQATSPPQEPKLKEYGYVIEMMTQLYPTEIEWTTETTDEKLQTTSKVTKTFHKAPEQEIDPSCQPGQLIPMYRNHWTFLKKADPEWKSIRDFFKISEDYDPSMMHFSDEDIYHSVPLMMTLIEHNKDLVSRNCGKEYGAKFFYKFPEVAIPVEPVCEYMMTNQAMAMLYPFLGKQIVNIDSTDLLRLAYYPKLKIDTLSEKAQADMKETDVGCILFIYRPKYMSSVPNCNITLVGIRNDTHCVIYQDEYKVLEERCIFRLAGMEREDYFRKMQEDKIAKLMAEQAAQMDTT
ncbi:RNA cytosine-C(5)-methyltransferase NSUN2-like [Mya arenaria]|uniref:RNA cytosine-C(5)-methyltransferase NSUN2-like n=1 Tax=Mya arenaria TaxID=6604 RepID=UPI0022E5A9BE|nr:RNA cytosine-C(5)-methyltransferase NSUN2-like [Mya arenaria]